MGIIMGIAVLAIDVSSWYERHHHDQVVADSAALAAANCLGNPAAANTTVNGVSMPACSSGTDASDAQNLAVAYAAANDLAITTSNVTVDTGAGKVTVTASDSAPPFLASVFGIGTTTETAQGIAHYGASCVQVAGSPNCISMFAGNNTCPTAAPGDKHHVPSPPTGLDLLTGDRGGGGETITDAFSNGYFYNGANSGNTTLTVTGVPCSADYPSPPNSKNTTFTTMPQAIPYPEVWSDPPTCTYTASYWTTNTSAPLADQIDAGGRGPGVYCTTPGVSPSACSDGLDQTAGAIYVGALSGSGYEFVGPCITLSGSATVQSSSGQPLVYGTSNISIAATAATATTAGTLPTCTVNNEANGSTYIDGNNTVVGGVVYDQCGTVVVEGNGTSVGFVEAWNIEVVKNNVTGDGPTTVNGVISPDQLIG